MTLKCLLFCSDDKIVRVLRRVLGDLEISVEHCTDSDSAIRKLTRQRFEAVIVDCTDEKIASLVLRSARSAPCNKRAVAVAIVDGQNALRSAFELGAHFVLYKPVSSERAKASFRAARALMKCERRRNTRFPVQIPVTLVSADGSSQQNTTSTDLSEGGMALQQFKRPKNASRVRVQFTLPGMETKIECAGEFAWENAGRQSGVRFVDISTQTREQLNSWLQQHSPEMETDDPPVACKLSDLSLGGCYLEMASPFPVRTRLVLAMKVGQLEVEAEGMVRVMHPEVGMGVELTQHTTLQREQVEKFIQALMNSNGVLPELMVKPEGMDNSEGPLSVSQVSDEVEDPLLDLFRIKSELTTDEFQIELRKQRGSHSSAEATVPA
ncbi:MAG TPA: PilZ domain-containing protein [Terriglobales bacterium]|jgi:CheY-like chemotaxis protein|nr:PilZ domain-containing protein [Terriglobales bacterium]